MARSMPGRFDAERRVSRSSNPLLALARLLETARRDARVEAMAVADQTGCLVAGAGAARTCDELAALAPLLPANDTTPTRLEVLAQRTALRRVRVNGVEVLLACRGDGDNALLALELATAGCRRILGRT
jgi:hypothetical protein